MISGIHISTSEVLVQNKSSSSHLPGFKKGQKVLARVLSRSPDGMAQLLVNGRQLSAKTPVLLQPGQEVLLQVTQEKDALIFKLIGPAKSLNIDAFSKLAAFFSKNGSLPDITGKSHMDGLGELLKEISLKSGKADASFLPRLIEKGGLLWEKKLAGFFSKATSGEDFPVQLSRLLKSDIKAHLLGQMRETAVSNDGGLKPGGNFLENLENFQMLNRNNLESGRFLLPFPVFSDQQFQFGQLLIDNGSGKNDAQKKKRMIRVSFLLNMTDLGPIRADFSILKKEIAGQFLLGREDVCEYMNGCLPDLTSRLSRIDYQVRSITCRVAQPEQIEQSVLMEQVLKREDSQVLNIMV